MSTLFVSYFSGAAAGVANEPLGSVSLDTSSTTARTSANPGASIVAVFSTEAHWVNTGPAASVTATATNGCYLPANVERHLFLHPGYEVAARTVA